MQPSPSRNYWSEEQLERWPVVAVIEEIKVQQALVRGKE